MESVFEYNDYKKYIVNRISTIQVNGVKTLMANFINCHGSYITNVLSGDKNFSLEQAEATSRFFDLNDIETEYFLLLVQYERSGNDHLRNIFRKYDFQKAKKYISKLYQNNQREIEEKIKNTYYSKWYIQAIHLITYIPRFQTAKAISKKLNLPMPIVDETLLFLTENKLLIKSGDRYTKGNYNIHLTNKDNRSFFNHLNWKLKILNELNIGPAKDNLNMSVILTLSEKDLDEIRKILLAASNEVLKKTSNTKHEEMALVFIDLLKF